MAKKPKKYTIRTIEDLCKVITLDNAENVLKDFRAMISQWLYLKTLHPKSGIKLKEFTWIDDGKHQINFKIDSIKKRK